jgi:hypothetical protein
VNLRNGRTSEPASFGYPYRVTGVGLVTPYPQELAQLPLVINVDLIPQISQAASDVHSCRGLETDPHMSLSVQAGEFAV